MFSSAYFSSFFYLIIALFQRSLHQLKYLSPFLARNFSSFLAHVSLFNYCTTLAKVLLQLRVLAQLVTAFLRSALLAPFQRFCGRYVVYFCYPFFNLCFFFFLLFALFSQNKLVIGALTLSDLFCSELNNDPNVKQGDELNTIQITGYYKSAHVRVRFNSNSCPIEIKPMRSDIKCISILFRQDFERQMK